MENQELSTNVRSQRGPTGVKLDRAVFWRYAIYASTAAIARASKRGVPCNIDAYYIDRLLVDQGWRCAISGIDLEPPGGKAAPFGPSLDRIVPALGYVTGNVRIVCNLVNWAMNQWGEEPLRRLIEQLRNTP